ncbi:Nucleotide-binding universal stress protein, UspA family [Lutimaribacter pacificus]|uniref:Nucleotide-binding universal stress protein, UspA family n=1 Tax=Lutimaribacter pacificus TaxID=391948 RepID=A0A1H0KZQ2_9RHOB|nr:universal stress protein [Lutimaribacter pacificus]SDO61273.1 Nucleotide-binding universal stress protein, UspA family [Lutimaribacter pacificus]SHK72398.1 Nucleotide-binding universal stress protein, UspA family [Lutimaribacter pacificus]
MYSNILVPISFDEDRNAKGAIEVAQMLGSEGAKITLLHVMEEIPGYAISYMPTDYIAESRKAVQSELEAQAAALPNAQGVVVEGHSGRTILDWAEDHGVDCIVVASHRPGMQDLLLGSTAHQVVRHATCAVHVLR